MENSDKVEEQNLQTEQEQGQEPEGKKTKKILWLSLLVFFVIITIIGGVMMYRRAMAQKSYDDLSADVNATDEKPDLLDGVEIPAKDLNWDELRATNDDIYAWIYVSGVNTDKYSPIDYPVLQHPTDDSFYLNYNLDKKTKGFPGCLYTEGTYNGKDFEDVNTVIYGHNLATKEMFTGLHTFEDPEYFNANDYYIYIYTPDKIKVYKVFGAFETNNAHQLAETDWTNEYAVEQYIKNEFENNYYGRVVNMKEDLRPTAEDKIITLSTCTPDRDATRRFLVQGVLLGEKDVSK